VKGGDPTGTYNDGAENDPLLSHFCIEMIILPRQARDKHREQLRTETEAFSAGCQLCWSAPGLQAYLLSQVKLFLRASPNATVLSISNMVSNVTPVFSFCDAIYNNLYILLYIVFAVIYIYKWQFIQ
jgi:hypothetical protein